MTVANREYKDRLFSYIYGSPEHRDWTLSLYNAVNGTGYDDPDSITITTMREVLYLGMHNDVSFLIAGQANLYEQQSTYNPNMPLRMLQYLGGLFEKHLREARLDKFGPEVVPLPTPKLVVFYNGVRDAPDESVLRLSDAFPAGSDPDVEVRVRMLNVNAGHIPAVMEACETLREYAWLVATIRDNRKSMGLADAVDLAIEDMPTGFALRPFLAAHKAEVVEMLLTEYNEAEVLEIACENAERRGEERGERRGEKRGERRGEARLSRLMGELLAGGMADEALRAATDEEYRARLYRERGIS